MSTHFAQRRTHSPFFPEWKQEWVPMTPAFCSTQKQYIFKRLQFAELQ